MKCLTTDALLWLENTLMFHIKPSTAPLTHWNHHAEENSPPQSSTEEYSVVLVSTQSQSWTTTWHSINTETKSKNQITFSKCWNVDILLFIHLFVCMQPRFFCMCTKVCANFGMVEWIWLCGHARVCVCVCVCMVVCRASHNSPH